ncbi:MAG: hypothetical protein ACC656_01025, partial [Candidatus Heimdallarchaeota archaeon]
KNNIPCILRQDEVLFSRQTNLECGRCHLKFLFGRNHPVLKLKFFVLTSPNIRIQVRSPYLFQKFLLEEWIKLSFGRFDEKIIEIDGKLHEHNDLFSDSDLPKGEILIWLDTAYVKGDFISMNYSFTTPTSGSVYSARPSLLEGRQFRTAPMSASVKRNPTAKLAGILILTNKTLIFKRNEKYIPFDLSQFRDIKFSKNKILIQLGASLGGYEYEVKDIARWERYYNIIKKSI